MQRLVSSRYCLGIFEVWPDRLWRVCGRDGLSSSWSASRS